MQEFVDTGWVGRWAESALGTRSLAAPHLMPVEVANILRRAAQAEHLDAPLATLDMRLTAAPGIRCEFTTPPAT